MKHGKKPEPSNYLTTVEEEELQSFKTKASRVGYGKTQREFKLLDEAIAWEKGVLWGEKIANVWLLCLLERMPKLTLRHKDATANVCMEALDVDEYFKLFEETLKMHDLMDSPCQIYNVYETGSDLIMSL